MSASPHLLPAIAEARAAARGRFPFAFGPRFFLALAIGLVWLGPAWWDRRFAYVMLAWDALVLLAWYVDLRWLPRPPEITVSRECAEALSLGVESTITLAVRNHAAVPLHVILYDETPAVLRSATPQLELDVPAPGSAQQSYAVQPAQRGDTSMGDVFLRYRSPLKLAERWAAAGLKQAIRVYPNLRQTKQFSMYLIRSRQIEQEKRLERWRGRGREFESLREYRGGDEPRDICWTATARRTKLITRVYQAERSQRVFIILDAGRLMLARIGAQDDPLTKLDYAVNAALTLAEVALYSGDRVALLAYGRKIQARVAPARGASHLRLLLDRLALVRGELAEADHHAAATILLQMRSQRSLMIWITDIAETAAVPEVIEAASGLLARHLLLFVAIGQPQLKKLVSARPESVEQMYRYIAAQEMVQRREILLRRLRERGALVLDLQPGRLVPALVNQYLAIKEKGVL